MKKFNKANNGFTLVELLVTVIIIGVLLGVGIAAVMHFIDRAKEEQRKSNEQALVMAAKNYLQENRGLLPKSIGETTTVYISVLKENKYITDTLTNQKHESCMENSYVEAYKKSDTKYTYTAHIYCGSETVVGTVVTNIPSIKIDFVDASGNSLSRDSSILEKVSEARFIIDYSGSSTSEKVPIDGYSYSILVVAEGESSLHEVYSSGTLSANRATDIRVDSDNNLSDYIDITGQTTVAIKAVVRNINGGISDKVEFAGGTPEQAQAIYQDKTDPTCVTSKTIDEPRENDWINLNNSATSRKITVVCTDGSGSGCIRSNFTKTWTGNVEKEFDTIEIKDNAGNTNNCRVRVNYDKKYPQITLDAFARGRPEDSTMGDSILTGPKSNSSGANVTINANQYKNLATGNIMNKAKYPNGVIYKITLKDGVALKNWKWEVNRAEIESTSDSRFGVVGSFGEAKSGTCTDKQCNIYVNFYENGFRKGVLTVYDKAGNVSTYTIFANIDRRAPDPPTIINSSSGNSIGAWTRDNVTLTLSTGNSLSAIADYYYTYSSTTMDYSGVNESDAATKWVKFANSYGIESGYVTRPWDWEINKEVFLSVCDVAGNCSDASSTHIMIDRTAPTGLRVAGYKKTSESNVTSSAGLDAINNNTWHKGWVVVVPEGTTDSGSKGIYYLVTVTGASTHVTDAEQSYRNVNAEGETQVFFRACDKLDNCTASVGFTVKLDRTGPSMPVISNSSNSEWTTENVVLTFSDSYDAGSQIGKYYYTYNSSASSNGSSPNSNWVEMTEGENKDTFSKTWENTLDYNKKVFVKVCDKVGNCSTANSTYIKIDNNAPVLTSISNPYEGKNVWSNKNFSVTLTSNDGDGSGIANYYQYTYSAQASTVGTDSATQWVSKEYIDDDNKVTDKFSIERDQTAYIRVCDKVGNCSEKKSTEIQLDKTKPDCGELHITSNDSTAGVGGYFECSDPLSGANSHSGCTSDKYSFSGKTSSDSIEIKDKANNTRTCALAVGSYDCSDYGEWEVWDVMKSTRNRCPTDSSNMDYEWGTCSSGFHSGECSVACTQFCADNPSNCSTAVCCVKRIKTNPRICFTVEE